MNFGYAADGLVAAIISGVFALLLWWLQSRGMGPRRKDAWQRQAEALRSELRRKHEADEAYLKGQLDAKDVALAQKDHEIARLNRLLTKQGAGSD